VRSCDGYRAVCPTSAPPGANIEVEGARRQLRAHQKVPGRLPGIRFREVFRRASRANGLFLKPIRERVVSEGGVKASSVIAESVC
jgi:hypothetical protein